jgi:hypothetical protein
MSEPMISPLDVNGDIYALQDEKGNTVGTGTREICEVLVHLMKKQAAMAMSADLRRRTPVRANVRAAIVI